jgi:predicted transport protein
VPERWTCPECRRRFGKVGQGHDCAPALTLEEYFATGPPHERPVYEAVRAHLDTLDDVYTEPVSVGIFFKRSRKFVELRPRRRGMACSMILPHALESDRATRRIQLGPRGVANFVTLVSAGDVDEELRQWLAMAYDAAARIR